MKAEVQRPNMFGHTPLHLAAQICSEAIGPLLTAGAQDALDMSYSGPLCPLALNPLSRSDFTENLRLLLAARMDVNSRSHPTFPRTGETVDPRLLSYLHMSAEDVRPLASEGSNPPLLTAILANRPENAMALLEAGADPLATFWGRTLSEYARCCGRSGPAWEQIFSAESLTP